MRPEEITMSMLKVLTRIADSLESIAKSQRALEPKQMTYIDTGEYNNLVKSKSPEFKTPY